MAVGDTSLDKVLGFAVVLAFAEGVAPGCELERAVDQGLGNFIQINEHPSRVGIVVQCLVKVFAVVDASDDLANDLRDFVHLTLLRHKINFIVQSFGHLQDRVDEEPVI